MSLSKCVALLVLAAGFATPASATLGPVAVAYVDSSIYYNPFSANLLGLGEVSQSSLLGTASAAAYAGSLPRVEVSGSTGALGTYVNADSYMTYSFVILSPQPGFADVLINANAGANGVGSFSAFGEADLVGVGVLAYAHACEQVGYCSNVYTSGGTHAYSLKLNKFYTFRLEANGHTTNAFSEFYAFADPTVTFNPAFAAPAGATIAYSPGFTGPAGVPEPATWGLLLVGFGLVGGLTRRNQLAAVKVRVSS